MRNTIINISSGYILLLFKSIDQMTLTLALFFAAHYAIAVHFIDAVVEITQKDY